MRSRWTILAAVAATLWVAPQLAAAEDVEEQLRQMNERMAQMEQQLQATNEELEASKQRVEQQQSLIQDLDEDRQASSALSKFLSETEFSGLVAASYTYNFKNLSHSSVGRNAGSTTGGENAGILGLTAPHHQNSNNFQIDQLAFRMKKTPTPESRAGWGASLVFGSSADSLAGRSPSCGSSNGFICSYNSDATGDLPHLAEAYAAYLFDVGSGVKLLGGRYMTPVGAESFYMNENINITRGLLWTLQPVNHTGGYISGEVGEGLTWQLGASNSYGNTMSDSDKHPTFVGSVGYSMDTLGFRVNGVYGGDIDDLFSAGSTFGLVGGVPPNVSPIGLTFFTGKERGDDKIGLLDAVLTWDPSDALSTWVNFDYYWTADSGGLGFQGLSSLSIYGIAGAGRYAITESTGFGLRYEWLYFNDFGFVGSDASLMSLTGTLDHHLTDNLVVRVEGRWDRGRAQDFPDALFLDDVAGFPGAGQPILLDFLNNGTDHQVLGLVQLMYEF
jgi:hypothetical protein